MFQEFMHPEIVLFGSPLKSELTLHHDYATKDGQIIVHQKINRLVLDMAQYPSRRDQELKEKKIARQKGEEFPQKNIEDSQSNVFKSEEGGGCMESPRKEGNIQGYYQNEQNPFDQGYYGFNMDAQYPPQQFGTNEAQSPLRPYANKSGKAGNIPFASPSPGRVQQSEEERQGYAIEAENAFIAGVAEVEFGGSAVDFIDDLGECV